MLVTLCLPCLRATAFGCRMRCVACGSIIRKMLASELKAIGFPDPHFKAEFTSMWRLALPPALRRCFTRHGLRKAAAQSIAVPRTVCSRDPSIQVGCHTWDSGFVTGGGPATVPSRSNMQLPLTQPRHLITVSRKPRRLEQQNGCTPESISSGTLAFVCLIADGAPGVGNLRGHLKLPPESPPRKFYLFPRAYLYGGKPDAKSGIPGIKIGAVENQYNVHPHGFQVRQAF